MARNIGRLAAALLVGLLAGCGPAPLGLDKLPEEAAPAAAPSAAPEAEVAAPVVVPDIAVPRSRPKAPEPQAAVLPSGLGSVTAETQADRDRLTVTAPPLNGTWRLEIPLEMASDESRVEHHERTALYCRLYHDGVLLALRCAAAKPLSDPAETQIDGARIRFTWRFDGGTLTIDAEIRSLQELEGQIIVQPDKKNAKPLTGLARLVRLEPEPAAAADETLLRALVEDFRQDEFDKSRYAPGQLDILSDHPALRRRELAKLGALERVAFLGEMPILNRDLDSGRQLAGFAAPTLAMRVYDLAFAEDSRLCALLRNDAGQVYSFNCY